MGKISGWGTMGAAGTYAPGTAEFQGRARLPRSLSAILQRRPQTPIHVMLASADSDAPRKGGGFRPHRGQLLLPLIGATAAAPGDRRPEQQRRRSRRQHPSSAMVVAGHRKPLSSDY